MTTQVLDENLLISEFTFGFELEGCVYGNGEIGTIVDEKIHRYDSEEYEDREYAQNETIKDELDNYLKNSLLEYASNEVKNIDFTDSKVHVDGSVRTTAYQNDYPFEYSSPIFPCKPSVINAIIKFLYNLLSTEEIYTNNSCGFHHHISFKGMNERDMIWMYCNLCCDENAKEKLKKLNNISLYSNDYASYDDMDKLKTALYEKDWSVILYELNTDKYRSFRIHPQGTLEWRGPRNFLNEKSLQYIKDFYKLLWYLMNNISKYLKNDKMEGTGISKKEFFNSLKDEVKNYPNTSRTGEFLIYKPSGVDVIRHLNYKSDAIKKIERDERAFEKFIEACNNNPNIWVSLVNNNPKMVGRLIQAAVRFGSIPDIANVHAKIFDNIKDESVLNAFANNILDVCVDVKLNHIHVAKLLKGKAIDYLDPSKAILIAAYNLSVDAMIQAIVSIVKSGKRISLGDVKRTFDQFISISSTYPAIIGELVLPSAYNVIGFNSTKKLMFYCLKKSTVHDGFGSNCEEVRQFVQTNFTLDEMKKWNYMLVAKSVANENAIRYAAFDISNGIPEELKWAYIKNRKIADVLPRSVADKLENDEKESYNDLI